MTFALRPRFLSALKRHAGDERGSVLVEFAFAMPILLMMVLGCYEAARYVLINQKMDRAAATIADLVAQPQDISTAELTNLFSAADEVMSPFDLQGSGRVIVTSISRNLGETNPVINWQRQDDSSLSVVSSLGASGQPSLPAGFSVREEEDVIVAEVFFDYQPRFVSLLDNLAAMFAKQQTQTGSFFSSENALTKLAFRRPRLGSLDTLN